MGQSLPTRTDKTPGFYEQQTGYAFIILLVFYLVGVAMICWPTLQNNGFPLDDSWIHQVIGRNLADYGVIGFNPGISSSGSSSTIWPWIIAFNYLITPSVSPIAFLLTVNCICLLIIVSTLFYAAIKDGLTAFEALLLGVLVAFTGNFVWLVATGMEHLLLIACLFLGSYLWLTKQTKHHSALALISGALAGLAVLTRSEAVVFLPAFVGAGILLGKTRRELVIFVLPCLLAIMLVGLNNFITSHSVLPVTYSGRKWLLFGDTPPNPLILIGSLLKKIALQVIDFSFGAENYATKILALILSIPLFIVGCLRLIRYKAWRILFLLLLAVINLAVYAFMLPTTGHGMRYQAILLIFCFPLLALGGLEIMQKLKIGAMPALILRGIFVIGIIGLAFTSLLRWSQITDAGIKHINATHLRMANWLAENLAGETVASFDIGGIGYAGKIKLIDLGGLTDPNFVPYLYAHKSADYLKQHGVRWLVLPTHALNTAELADSNSPCFGIMDILSLCDSAELSKREIVSFSSPGAIWETGFAATGHALQGQTLYEITWR